MIGFPFAAKELVVDDTVALDLDVTRYEDMVNQTGRGMGPVKAVVGAGRPFRLADKASGFADASVAQHILEAKGGNGSVEVAGEYDRGVNLGAVYLTHDQLGGFKSCVLLVSVDIEVGVEDV